MKKQIITASFALMCALVVAAPAKRGLYKTVKTANGRLVKVELRGDEFCHYWQAEDGSRLVRNAKTGQFETADMADLSRRAAVRRGMAEQQRARRAPAPKSLRDGAARSSPTGAPSQRPAGSNP